MKRCIYCLNECADNATSCPQCGFSGAENETNPQNCLPIGTRLNNRYVVGGVSSKSKVFTSYYALDIQTRQRVRISEYLNEKLIYRLPGELIIKYVDERCRAKGDKEIAAYYSHYTGLCGVSESTVLDFLDCFAENSTFYYVCTLPAGAPLSSLIGNGRVMSFSKSATLIKPVVECALRLAQAGKWHGGISPYTVITNEGRITALTGYSYPPKSIHSPFDAPEKQLGARHCGAFTDVYSIGAILYEAVTGTLPPSATERSNGKPLCFPESISDKERRIIEKALAFDKNERYPSAAELVADIGGWKPEAKKPTVNSNSLRRIILVVAVLVISLGAGILINNYIIEPKREDSQSEELAQLVSQATTSPMADPWIDIQSKYPNIQFPEGMNPSFADLYAINPEFAGWVSIPEMNINLPIVQAEDNDKYLRRDIYEKYTSYGVPFFDYRCGMKNLSRNTIIYGHNMRHDDKLFGTLEQYRTPDGFRKAPLIGMSTLYGDHTFKIYAVYISNSKKSDDNGRVFNYIFVNAGVERFRNYIAEIDKRKLYTTGVDINENDKIITLSTCCYDFADARLVVVGRLLREGESAEVDFSLVQDNPNPKYPQVYYDIKRTENPYRDDPIIFE